MQYFSEISCLRATWVENENDQNPHFMDFTSTWMNATMVQFRFACVRTHEMLKRDATRVLISQWFQLWIWIFNVFVSLCLFGFAMLAMQFIAHRHYFDMLCSFHQMGEKWRKKSNLKNVLNLSTDFPVWFWSFEHLLAATADIATGYTHTCSWSLIRVYHFAELLFFLYGIKIQMIL